jgi:hypothetical protein
MNLNPDKIAKDAYYINAEIIRFLMIENLALKALLHDKGIISPEDYKKRQKDATEMVDLKVNNQIEEWKRSNPKVMELLSCTDKSQEFNRLEDSPVVA